jgi:serine/threonine protein kinase
MAPEILLDQEYDGKISDIFSAGTVLFIMCSQFCPFINACKTDRYYSKIISGNWEELWETYNATSSGESIFSDSFKDLFQRLVAFNPEERPTLEQIKNHEWMNGATATAEEIVEEFTRRKKVKIGKNTKSEVASGATTDASMTSETKETKASNHESSPKKVCAKDNKRYTCFFKVNDPEELVSVVVNFAKANNFSFLKHEEYYRVDLKIKENSERVHIVVNILKKADGDSRCIQLLKSSGSQDLFKNTYSLLKRFLSKSKTLTISE